METYTTEGYKTYLPTPTAKVYGNATSTAKAEFTGGAESLKGDVGGVVAAFGAIVMLAML